MLVEMLKGYVVLVDMILRWCGVEMGGERVETQTCWASHFAKSLGHPDLFCRDRGMSQGHVI